MLKFNIKGQYQGFVPDVTSPIYVFSAFEDEVLVITVKDRASGKSGTKRVDVKKQVNAAWNFVLRAAAPKDMDCANYFKALSRKKTLQEILNEGDITLHRLEPRENYTYDDLVDANTADRHIGINPWLLFQPSKHLGCVLIHELAHIAGATTNKYDPHAGDAEDALNHCACKEYFNRKLLGTIQRVELRGYGGSLRA